MLEFEFSRVLRVQTATPAFAGDLVERALGRQGVELGGGAAVAEHATGPVAVRVVDEVVAGLLGLRDAPLRSGVRRHVVAVPVQVVRGDVEQDGHVRAERGRAVELEAADLNDGGLCRRVASFVPLRQAAGPARADVSNAVHVPSFVAQHVVDHRRGGGLAVGACDGDHRGGVALRREDAAGVFDVADDFPSLRPAGVDNGGVVWDARTLDHHLSVHPRLGAVAAELVADAVGLHFRRTRPAAFPGIAHVRTRTHGLRQQGGAHAAFAGAQNQDGICEVHGTGVSGLSG